MKTLKEEFQEVILKFTKEHSSEIKDTWDYLGFRDYEDMLEKIQSDFNIAVWAFTELFSWGLNRNYRNELFTASLPENFDSDPIVHKITNSNGDTVYFRLESVDPWNLNYEIIEMTEVTEYVKITKWIDK